jgi:hypothetical protein
MNGNGTDRDAVKKILTFLALTLLFSLVFYRLIIRAGMEHATLQVLALMWCPGTAAMITRLVYQRNLRGTGWGWGKTRYQVWSYFLPILYALPAYLVVWFGGLGKFPNYEFVQKVAARLHLGSASPAATIVILVAI